MGKRGTAAVTTTPWVPAAKAPGRRGVGRSSAAASSAASGAAAGAASGGATIGPAPLVGTDHSTMNAKVYAELQKKIHELEGHKEFIGIHKAQPLSMESGGKQEPLSEKAFKAAMGKEGSGEVRAAGNFFWQIFEDRVDAGIPLNLKSIERMQKFRFKQPTETPRDITVFVRGDEDIAKLMRTAVSGGFLERGSPVEIVIAQINQMHEDIIVNIREDEATAFAKLWRLAVLRTPFLFIKMESAQSKYFYSIQWRENLSGDWAGMRHNALQKIYGVIVFFTSLPGNPSAKEVADLYREHVTYADDKSENDKDNEMSDSFVEMALTVHHKVLCHGALRDKLMALASEEGMKNPLDSVVKMNALATKGKIPEVIVWAGLLMIDFYESGALPSEGLSTRQLLGQSAGSNGKGLIDLMAYKREFKEYFTGPFLDERTFPSEVKAKMREITASVSAFRAAAGYGYIPSTESLVGKSGYKTPSLTWRAKWDKSAELFFELVDSTVFGYQHDPSLKCQLKNRRDVLTAVGHEPWAEMITEIDEALEAEKKAAEKLKKDQIRGDDDDDNKPGSDLAPAAPPPDEHLMENLVVASSEDKAMLQQIIRKVDDTTIQKIQMYEAKARTKVAKGVDLCPETWPDAKIVAFIKDSGASQVVLNQTLKEHAAIEYDIKNACEARKWK